MIRYPIGTQDFKKLRNNRCVYVDKTALIYRLATEGSIYFLSRPRRFGKSLLVSTLKYYFQGHKELFQGLAMERLEQDWTPHAVLHVDFSIGNFTRPGFLEELLDSLLSRWEKLYGRKSDTCSTALRFANVIEAAHLATGQPVVVLVDEYDKPLLDVLETEQPMPGDEQPGIREADHRELLKEFYSVFKLADEHLRFVLLTGVTKFSQISIFSGFNQPEDITSSGEFDTICGITPEELHQYFQNDIEEMATQNGLTAEAMCSQLKAHYDGYHFSRKMRDVYNPFSLLNALKEKAVADYWFRTGTPSYLLRLMANSRQNLMNLAGKFYEPAQFADCKANVEQLLPMIYQSGYFTIKQYDRETGLYLLDFPNQEVARGFLMAATEDFLHSRFGEGSTGLLRLGNALLHNDMQTFRTELTALFAGASYRLRAGLDDAGRETYFQYGFYLVLRMIGTFTVEVERETSHGRIDCVVQTPRYTYIMEFKRDSSARRAMEQINQRDYPAAFRADGRSVMKIGINFSSESGTVNDFAAEADTL